MASIDDLVGYDAGNSGVTVDDLVGHDAAPAAQPQAASTIAAKPRGAFDELGRQAGLTARYLAEGPAQVLDIVGQPIRYLGERMGVPPSPSIGQGVSGILDRLGVPKPENPTERVVGDVSRMLSGGGGLLGGARGIAAITEGTPAMVANAMAAQPAMQGASAVGSGAAGGYARENGASQTGQFAASLLGGLAAPMGIAAGSGAVNRLSAMLPKSQATIDLKLSRALKDSGIDWASIPAQAKATMRAAMGEALSINGDINPDAVRRLADFARVSGATPTRGMLTLDPVQITREQNLAKAGANSADSGMHGLANVQNQNNRALIENLNQAGAAGGKSGYDTGAQVISALESGINGRKATINDLYNLAKDSAGRSFPLDGRQFADTAIKALDDNLLGGSLPVDVRNHLNAISKGEVPFTVDYAEQLKTRIGNLQRASNDGSARMALSLVRKAIDDAPVVPLGGQASDIPVRSVNPGNLPAVAGSAKVGEDAVAAFNKARAANRAMMSDVESAPALRAVYEGTATPDQFMNKFVIGSSATADNVRALKSAISHSPEAVDATKGYIAQWLKDKALNGASDEVGNFSPAAYEKALKAIGDEKLKLYFPPEEIEQLKSIGRVGRYMNAQPKGSAVNNSNSGAMLVGHGLDFLNMLGSKIPLLNIGPQVQTLAKIGQERAATQIGPSLMIRRPPNQLINSAALIAPYAQQDQGN